jgi:hypothetical protein
MQSDIRLEVIQSTENAASRGTWRDGQRNRWVEIDHFVAPRRDVGHFKAMRTLFFNEPPGPHAPKLDHRAKAVTVRTPLRSGIRKPRALQPDDVYVLNETTLGNFAGEVTAGLVLLDEAADSLQAVGEIIAAAKERHLLMPAGSASSCQGVDGSRGDCPGETNSSAAGSGASAGDDGAENIFSDIQKRAIRRLTAQPIDPTVTVLNPDLTVEEALDETRNAYENTSPTEFWERLRAGNRKVPSKDTGARPPDEVFAKHFAAVGAAKSAS